VGPRILGHRAPADQAAAIDSREPLAKPSPPSAHAKNQVKTAQKNHGA